MSKKITFLITSSLVIVSLMIFSIANAFALEGAQADGTPLTSAKQLCKELQGNLSQTLRDIDAIAISQQLSKEKVKQMKADAKAYKKLACDESKDATKICKELRNGYKDSVAFAKAKGLSGIVTKEEQAQILNDLKINKKYWCGKATTLTSAVKLCKEAKNSYEADKAAIDAKAISLQLTQEVVDQMKKDLKDYKSKLCKEAKIKA